MPAPTVVSTSPATGENSVYKNKAPAVTFSVALLPSSVNTGTIYLENVDSGEVVPSDVSLSASGLVVTLTPTRHLLPETLYRLSIVGANTAVDEPIQSSTSDDLATTLLVLFTTGNEIEIPSLQKTEEQIEQEGELSLPSNVQVVPSVPFYISGSLPGNKEFGVDPDLAEIIIEFSENVLGASVTSDNVIVAAGPYYEEDEDFLARPDTADPNFQWQDPQDTSGDPMDFTQPTGTLSVSGNRITWTRDPLVVFPNNTRVRVTLKSDIMGTSGEQLDGDYQIDFYINPCPDVVSVDRVRDEFAPYVLQGFTDDMIGKTLYKNAIEALDFMRYEFGLDNVNRTYRQYVLAATVSDIISILRFDDVLLGGQFKRLGDMAIRYDVRAMNAMPGLQARAVKDAERFKDMLIGRFSRVMMPAVRGAFHPTQRIDMRTRLWKQDLFMALEGWVLGSTNAGNTRNERAAKVPGIYNAW
jgi:hypothetical protein